MSRTGSGCRRIAFTTVKIVVFKPKPSASEITATALNPLFFSSMRTPNFKSATKSCAQR